MSRGRINKEGASAPSDPWVRCPLCADMEHVDDMVGGVCLACSDAITMAHNERRANVRVAPSPTEIVLGPDEMDAPDGSVSLETFVPPRAATVVSGVAPSPDAPRSPSYPSPGESAGFDAEVARVAAFLHDEYGCRITCRGGRLADDRHPSHNEAYRDQAERLVAALGDGHE